MQQVILFIDDERFPSDFLIRFAKDHDLKIEIARTGKEAIALFAEHADNIVSYEFDHDLGEGDDASWIVMMMVGMDLDSIDSTNKPLFNYNAFINVHSQNPVGAFYLKEKLRAYFAYQSKRFNKTRNTM